MVHDLLLNSAKSEASYFGTRQQLNTFNLPTDIVVADSNILVNDLRKILGVIIDKHCTFVPHAQCVVKSCNYHVQALRRIRHLLSRDVANRL